MERIETVRYKNPDQARCEQLGAWLRAGKLVVIPTETVYGLGANGLDAVAMRRIYAAKGRPSDNPLILHVPDKESVRPLVKEIPPLAEKLMDAFWPGPLTIIMEKSDLVPKQATGGLDTVALRCPDHEICRQVLRCAGVPVAAPSANISGRPSPTSAGDVYQDMKGRVEAIIDCGPCRIGLESTVVLCEKDSVMILRPGAITEAMLQAQGITVTYDQNMITPEVVPKAPGMKYKHYAPDAPMQAFVGESVAVAAAMAENIFSWQKEVVVPDKNIILPPPVKGLLVSEEVLALLQKEKLAVTWLVAKPSTKMEELSVSLAQAKQPVLLAVVYGSRREYEKLARLLYRTLLFFNEAQVASILAEGVTEEGLGKAIMNRMKKAANQKIHYV